MACTQNELLMAFFAEKEIPAFLKANFGVKGAAVSVMSGKTDSSAVYLVESGAGKFVLKGSFWYQGFAKDPKAALEFVYQTAEMMQKSGASLQGARRGLSGDFVFELGGLPTVLLDYKEGLPFNGSDKHFTSAGAALANFHKTGVKLLKSNSGLAEEIQSRVPVEKPYEESRVLYLNGFRGSLTDAAHQCGHQSVCAAVRREIDLIDQTAAFVDTAFSKAEVITVGILHNDFNYVNGLYSSSGDFVAFLDVDQLGVGPLVLDIGNTLASFATRLFKEGKTVADFERSVRIFLSAYHQTSPLPLRGYELILAATEQWDLMRIWRTLRRHHFENDRLSELMEKITDRLLLRLRQAPRWFSFLTPDWIAATLG